MNLLTRISALALITAPSAVYAQAAPDLNAKLAALEAATKSAQSAGDNAWMLVSSALVLMMTAPGLALFYGGLVRRKNVLGTMMHSFILMAVVTVIWAVVGYSLAFGGSSPYIGDLQFAFLDGVGSRAQPGLRGTIPQQTFMVYQLMFAIITPALISGAFAERMKFSAMLLFTMLWTLVVYFPMAHMVWGKGGLLNAFSGGRIPCFDFAGGTVVHITSGVSALVCALYLGKRDRVSQQRHEAAQPGAQHHRRVPACGSAGSASTPAARWPPTAWRPARSSPRTSARLPPRSAGWRRSGWTPASPACWARISGCVAGLVAITPASGFVKPFPAMLIGLAAGVVCYFMVTRVKRKFGYDDALDAFGVHGAGGTLGALLTGVFATNAINDGLKDAAGKVHAARPGGRQRRPDAEPVGRHRHRLGSRHRGHAGHPQDRAI